MRNLGRLGESTFQTWCANDGISYNSSVIDETGWDFYLEMPASSDGRIPEVHDAAIECKVQVKATDGKHGKCSIKLSNLKKLASAPMPAFFVFLEFNGKSSPVRAFLVHMDKPLITKVLTRVYREEQLNGTFNHHAKSMTIKYEKSHEIKISEDGFLRSAIERHVGEMHKYVQEKQSHLRSTGFEGGAVTLDFSVEGTTALEDLIYVSIGAKKSVGVSNFRGFNTRFGLRNSVPSFEHPTALLEMPDLKASAVGYVKVLDEEHKQLKLACKFYISPFSNPNAADTLKFRVVGDGFELVASPHKGAVTFTFDVTTAKLPLRKLRDGLRFMRLMFSSSSPVDVEFIPEGRSKFSFNMNAGAVPFEHSDRLEAIDRALQVLSHVEFHEEIGVSLVEINRQIKHINFLWQILVKRELTIMTFSIGDAVLEFAKPAACIFKFVAPIGKVFIWALVVSFGRQTINKDGEDCLLTDRTVVERFYVLSPGERMDPDILEAHTRMADEKYEKDYQVFEIAGPYGG